MCIGCSAFSVPLCGNAVGICTQNFHQLSALAVMSAGAGLGSLKLFITKKDPKPKSNEKI